MRVSTSLLLLLTLGPLHMITGALVLRYLYHRLLVPTFPGLPDHLGIAAAAGLSLFISYLTVDEPSIANDERGLAEREVGWIAVQLLALASAFVIGAFLA